MLWCVCLCECVFALHLYANIIRFNRYGSVNSKCVCVMYSCPISRWPNFFECVSESFCGCNGFPLSSYLIFLSAFQWNATQLNVHTAFFLPRTVQSMTVAVTPPIRRSYDLRPLHPGWSVQMFCVLETFFHIHPLLMWCFTSTVYFLMANLMLPQLTAQLIFHIE